MGVRAIRITTDSQVYTASPFPSRARTRAARPASPPREHTGLNLVRHRGLEEGIEFATEVVIRRAPLDERTEVMEESAERPHHSSPSEALRTREIAVSDAASPTWSGPAFRARGSSESSTSRAGRSR